MPADKTAFYRTALLLVPSAGRSLTAGRPICKMLSFPCESARFPSYRLCKIRRLLAGCTVHPTGKSRNPCFSRQRLVATATRTDATNTADDTLSYNIRLSRIKRKRIFTSFLLDHSIFIAFLAPLSVVALVYTARIRCTAELCRLACCNNAASSSTPT